LGPAQCYSTNPVGFGQRRLPTALSATARRAAAVPTMPASLRCRRRVSLLPRLLYVPAMQPLHSPRAGARPLLHPAAAVPGVVLHNRHRIHRHSSALRDTHPKPTTALPTDPSQHHRPLLRPVTDYSPLPELPRAPPRTPMPPVFLHPSHHAMKSPPTHQPSSARQPPPSACRPRCRHRARPPVRPTVDAVDSPTPVRTPLF
jgi:hypothetical protein